MTWKNPYPQDDPRSLRLEYQHRLALLDNRFVFGLWSRQTGKDWTVEGMAVESCFRHPGTRWLVAAPSERQSLESLDKAKEWAAAFHLVIADYQETRESAHAQSLVKAAEITFQNGSRIRAVPGKPSTVRGESANVILTEFAFFEDPDATWRAIYPSITNPLRGGKKRLIAITTPNGVGNLAHRLWTKEDGKVQWARDKVTIVDAVRMGLPVDIDELREGIDDPDAWAQEYMCEFLDASATLLPYDLIALAESADATEADMDAGMGVHSTSGPRFVGIDFGRSNDPTVCWTLELVGGILWTREVLVLARTDTPDQQDILRSRIKSASRVCYDYTGPGVGLGDLFVREFAAWNPSKHMFGKVELCTFTAQFKRELFPRLRRAFEAPTRLRIPVARAIREDLHAMQQVVRAGEYNYWAPRTREGHSDRCTALALAIRAAGTGAPAGKPHVIQTNFSRARAERASVGAAL